MNPRARTWPNRVLSAVVFASGVGALLAFLSGIAWAQDPTLPSGHPVDWLSALAGGGGVTGLGVLLVMLTALGNRLGLSLPRITIGGSDPKKPDPDEETSSITRSPIAPDVERRLATIEGEQVRLRDAVARIDSNQSRAMDDVKELRDLAQQILLRLMDRNGGRDG